jgi:hypothetical protein
VASLRIHVPPRVERVVVNDGSAQRSMVTRLTVTFSEGVTLDRGAIEVLRQGGGSFTTHVVTQVLGGKTVAVVTFGGGGVVAGSLADGRYQLVLRADRIHDGHGNPLDGDDDGTAGGDRAGAFHRLFGDGDGDADVDWRDLLRFVSALGRRQGDQHYLWYMDVDGDDRVGLIDLLAFTRRVGTRLNP